MCAMKRWLMAIFALGLLASGCSKAIVDADGQGAPTASPAATSAAESVTFTMKEPAASTAAPATPIPTPTPTPGPKPTPEPMISADWYRERNETLARLMMENGAAGSIDEANAEIGGMQIDPDKPMLALTFDDGPTGGVTDKILDVLQKYNARATFFVVGSRVAGSEALLKRAVNLGCEIGCHTFNHDTLSEISMDRAKKSVEDTVSAVKSACGYDIRSLRPPKGENSDAIKSLALDENMALIYWNHSTHDYRIDSAKTIASYVQYDKENKKEIADGDIVLLHDLRKPTAEAVEEIVKTLTDQGYQLVTVQELLNLSNGGFSAGKAYKKQ